MKEAGIKPVAISYDSAEILAKFAEESEVKFPLFADEESKTIKAFGVVNEKAKGRMEGLAIPVTFVVGEDLRVLVRIDDTVYKRHKVAELIGAVEKAADSSTDKESSGNDSSR